MMVWLARRIVISLLIPYLWRWWRGRGASHERSAARSRSASARPPAAGCLLPRRSGRVHPPR